MANQQKLSEVKRQFAGVALIDEVIESVLEMFQGDVQQTIQFLQAGDQDYVEPANNQHAEALPADYRKKPMNFNEEKLKEVSPQLTNAMRVKNFFLQENNSLMDHLNEFKQDPNTYSAVILTLLHQGVSLSSNNLSKTLAASWVGSKNHNLFSFLLAHKQIGFPEVLKCLKVLDAPRKIAFYKKKIQKLELLKSKKKKISNLKKIVHNIGQECTPDQKTSVTGALAKRIREWIKTIDENQLNFFALQMPKEPWRELADMVHPNPKDFSVDWFLEFIYGKEAPENSIVARCANISDENISELVKEYKIPYSFIRTKVPQLASEVKKKIASYEPIETVLWYYEELSNGCVSDVNDIISDRLASGDVPKFNYGKFMERLLFFKQSGCSFYQQLIPFAEQQLRDIKLPLEPPVVVFGDASYSMDVAIRTSTIIASLLTALCDADLRFFNVVSYPPEVIPRSVVDVLNVALNSKADGLTAPACSIMEYYEQKKKVKCIIMVTDEIENEPHRNYFFAQLFYRYFTEVFPCKIVFVSFLDNPKKKGRMVSALEEFGIVPLQFRLDARRPDLTKLDTLFGLLASETFGFTERISSVVSSIEQVGGAKVIECFGDFYTQSSEEVLAEKLKYEAKEEERSQQKQGASDNNNNNAIKECGICQERGVDTALVDCGHLLCEFCSIGFENCPYCRKVIKGTLKIYAP
jgi:hypothetical protein